MADIVFNIAKGKINEYVSRVDANDPANSALVVVVLEASGLEADGTLQDYDTLAALLAASNNEQTTMGRKTLTDSDLTAPSPDDTNNRQESDVPDQTWAAATGNATGALVVCYDPDTTGGTDANLVPLTKHDFAVTPDGSDVVAQIAAAGFFRAS